MMYRSGLILLLVMFLSSCTSFIRFTSGNNAQVSEVKSDTKINDINSEYQLTDEKFTGYASYYNSKFNGRKTASGEFYNEDEFTAAHRTLPFGTKLLVRNLNNNKTVVVRVNDRGPFVKGRILDLSLAAAKELGMISSGVVEVEVIVLK